MGVDTQQCYFTTNRVTLSYKIGFTDMHLNEPVHWSILIFDYNL
jgi:hypothetical protein